MIEVTHEGSTIQVIAPGEVQINGKPHRIHREGGTELLRWMELREWPRDKRIIILTWISVIASSNRS